MTYRGSRATAAALAGLMLVAGCAKRTEVTLPALDASRTGEAEALVARVEPVAALEPPKGVVRGAGEGAAHGMGEYMGSAPSGDAAFVWLLLLPVALPVSAAVGASMAHSEAEVDAAAAAVGRVAADGTLAASLDRRLTGAIGRERRAGWPCVAAVSDSAEQPCPGAATAAKIVLHPDIRLIAPKGYDPEVLLLAEVVATVALDGAGPQPEPLLEAKWMYREKPGKYFALTANDAELLRRRLDAVLDGFALRIAADLYLDPQPASFVQVDMPGGRNGPDIPERTVVRVAQGAGIVSAATHGTVVPVEAGNCWIVAVDGTPTGQDRYTATGRAVRVKAGPARVEVACVRFPRTADERIETATLEIAVEAGATYVTDGETVTRR